MTGDRPHTGDAMVAVMLGFLAFMAAGAVGMLLVGRALGVDPVDVPLDHPRFYAVTLPLTTLAVAGVVVRLCRRNGALVVDALALNRGRRWWAVLLVLPAGLLSSRVVNGLMHALPGLDLTTLTDLASVARTPGALGVLVALCLILVVPLGEELLFRGYVFRGLHRGHGPLTAILASSVLFALFHFDLVQGAGVLIVGLAIGWVRQVTGSLLPAIAAHAPNNATWWATARYTEGTMEVPLWVDGVALAAIAFGVWWLRDALDNCGPPQTG